MTPLEQAFQYVNRLQIVEFFAFMKKHMGETVELSRLESTFIFGKTDVDFYPQLKALAQRHFAIAEGGKQGTNATTDNETSKTTNQTNSNMSNTNSQDEERQLYVIFADLKGYGNNAGNNPLLGKVTRFLYALKDKHFSDGKNYFFKAIGDGILATGHNQLDMTQKALTLRDEIKRHNWKGEGFPQNLNVRIALHVGEVIEHKNGDGTIFDVSGTAVIQAARLEPYVAVGEVFCSDILAGLLSQSTIHNVATSKLGTHDLGKEHDKFEMGISALYWESDKEIYEQARIDKFRQHLTEKAKSKTVEHSAIAAAYTPQSAPQTNEERKAENTASENKAQESSLSKDEFKDKVLALLEEAEFEDAIKLIMGRTRGTNMHPTMVAINADYKQYQKNALAGLNTDGAMNNVIIRLTQLVDKI